MTTLKLGSLFSGYGGLDLAANAVFDSETAWHCEFDSAPSQVLNALYPNVPNHSDVTAVDWARVEPVDILTGGFPCQDLSLAGRRAGMRPGTRSGLWSDFGKAIKQLKPKIVVIENVRGLLSGCAEGGTSADGSPMEPCQGCMGNGEHRPVLRALGRVLGDLASLGYDAEWGGIRAADVGAPHGRYRVFVVAYRHDLRSERGWGTWARGKRFEDNYRGLVNLPTGAFVFSTPDTMPDAPNANSNRAKQPGGLNDQVLSLLRTPTAAEDEGGPLHPDIAAERGQTLRLTGQMLALGGHLLPNGDRVSGSDTFSWGEYGPAVKRWETLTRPAPAPTKPDGRDAKHRLSSEFVEWMMGLPKGHVTGHGLTRKQELKMLGNGVVPQQGAEAIRQLWHRATAALEERRAA